jgi:glycosyltransferase involved in cell wall biosynthesis
MKFWLVNPYANTMSEAGLVRHVSMAKEMVRMGHEVTIVASDFNHLTFEKSGTPQNNIEEVEGGVKFWRVPTSTYSGNGLLRVWSMVLFALNFWQMSKVPPIDPPDAILGSSPHIFAALASQQVAQRYKIPFVMEIRDLWPQSFIDLNILPAYHPFIIVLSIIERYLYKKASKIVTLLPNSLQYLVNLGVKEDDIIHIPNGVSLDLVKQQPEHPQICDTFTVMYAGAHGHANSLDTVLDAMAKIEAKNPHTNIRLHLIGNGAEKPRLQKRAQDEKIQNVKFFNPVPKTEIYNILKTADCFLMPLLDSPVFYWGVSPNKLFDYFAVARPVIFAVNSPFDLVAEAEAGISIPPNNSQALADAMGELSKLTPAKRWEMSISGRKYLEQNHDLQKLARKLESTLVKVVVAYQQANL